VVIRPNFATKDEDVEIEITSEDFEPVGKDRYFIGISPLMRQLRASVALLARSDSPVAIVGEHGSGRETVARLLHTTSIRSGFEFARVNCAILPEDLLERELFGFETGGANESLRSKRGKLETCEGGTILLDEIAQMSLRLQYRLAQVIQEGQFTRRDYSSSAKVDVRVVVASSIPIDRAVGESRILEALASQFNVCQLRVPALRERKEELPLLTCHFMHRLAKHYGLPPRKIAQSVSEAWQMYDWPGNLRELEQSVKRYLVAGGGEFLFEESIPNGACEDRGRASSGPRNESGKRTARQASTGIFGYKSLRELLQSVKEEAEKKAIAWALETTGWNRKAAARVLKTSYRTVLYKIDQYHMSSSELSSAPARNGLDMDRAESYGENRTGIQAARVPHINDGRLGDQ